MIQPLQSGLAALLKPTEAVLQRIVSIISKFPVFQRVRLYVVPGCGGGGRGGAYGVQQAADDRIGVKSAVFHSLSVATLYLGQDEFLAVDPVGGQSRRKPVPDIFRKIAAVPGFPVIF